MAGKPMARKTTKPKATATPKASPATGAKPKFGSPEWNAKYGIKKLGKGKPK